MSETAHNSGSVIDGFPTAFMGRVLDTYGEWLKLSFDLGQHISNELWERLIGSAGSLRSRLNSSCNDCHRDNRGRSSGTNEARQQAREF
jgi:hypothetical protein